MLPPHTTLKSLAFAIFFLIVFSSCSNNSKKENEVIKALNEGIENSTDQIRILINDPMEFLKGKLQEMGSKERAQVWYPKAEEIQQLSTGISDYIENVKNKIKDSSINSAELFDKLKRYREQILQVDPKITPVFEKSLPVFTRSIESSKNNQEKLFKDLFKNTSSESALAILSRFQNNIKINELKLITFCNENVGCLDCGTHYTFSAIAIQSSSIVEGGGKLEIIAGVGSFSTRQKPEIFIYGKEVRIHEDGAARYKIKAPFKPGEYYVPIKISYIDQNGRQQTIQKEIEYTVVNIQKQ